MANEIWISSDYGEICKACKRFLKDPYSLIQKNSLPEHLCLAAMQQNTDDWASKKLMYPGLSEWSAMFPLPVGEKVFLDKLPHTSETITFASNLPFRTSEAAIFTIEFKLLDDTVITFFGLAKFIGTLDWRSGAVAFFEELDSPGKPKPLFRHRNPPEKDKYIDKYEVAGCKFVVTGDKPTSTKVIEEVNKLRQWWGKFEGKPIIGRPPGSCRLKSSEYIIDKYREYLDELNNSTDAVFDGKQPTQEDFAGYLGLRSRSTLTDALKRYGLNWPPDKTL